MKTFSRNFNRGDLVKVIKPNRMTSGSVGEVINPLYDTDYGKGLVLVRFEKDEVEKMFEYRGLCSCRNIGPRNFAYNPASLKLMYSLKNTEGNNMKKKLEGYTNVVRVAFTHDKYAKVYDFADYGDHSISIGDMVVVDALDDGIGYSLVIVKDIIPANIYEQECDHFPITREVVDVVDTNMYKERVEIRKQKEDLFKKLKAKADSMKEIQYFEILAEKDPEMAKMLKIYKGM